MTDSIGQTPEPRFTTALSLIINDTPQFGSVFESVAFNGNHIGKLTCFDRAKLLLPAKPFEGKTQHAIAQVNN